MEETPTAAGGNSAASANPPAVTDRRPVPRGVLPKGVQAWVMAGLALGMLAIMLIVGRPDPPARPAAATAPPPALSADRVRDYQDRMRALEAQALRDAQTSASAPQPAPMRYEDTGTPAPQDPIEAERKRREYESLFASNVALSRRPEAERPDSGRPMPNASAPNRPDGLNPSVDDIADAVLRATSRASGTAPTPAPGATQPTTSAPGVAVPSPSAQSTEARTPAQTDAISPSGPLHRLLEGTLIDTVLTNRLDGSSASPVNCLVTNPVYSHSGRHVVIPAGARILGETRPVQGFGEARLAVSFHRLLMPDGRTYRLDQFQGLNQIGDAGLRDRVNHHYLSTFGAAAAVGLISGLSQYLGSAGLASGDGDRTIVIAGGAGEATAQAALQVMNRFLNRLPTITIREGHRVKVYLTSDLELPAYSAPDIPRQF